MADKLLILHRVPAIRISPYSTGTTLSYVDNFNAFRPKC
jgi:hypothetical protein